MNLFNIVLLLVLLPIGESRWTRTPTDISISPSSDSTVVTRTVARFHDALQSGDTAGVRQLIAADLRVLEGGDVEDRAQYLAHHLAEDIEFAKGVRGETNVISYAQQGSVAWVVSTSTSVGKFNDRDINSVGAELIVLSRTREVWKIRAIHWSSRRR